MKIEDTVAAYDNMTHTRLAKMDGLERRKYYAAIYQVLGQVLFTTPQMDATQGFQEGFEGEYSMISAANNALLAAADAMSALSAMAFAGEEE